MRLKILWVGKTKNRFVRALAADYRDRVARFAPCEILEARDASGMRSGRDRPAAETKAIAKLLPGGCRLVVLDERGREMSSPDFARWLAAEMDRGTRELVFLIGGVEGVADGLLSRADLKLSLGRMTWTHEMCRVLLLEQLYRAFCILRNVPYHR